MEYDKKVITQQVLQQIFNRGAADKDQIKKEIIRIGMQAATRFLYYHSAKGIYSLKNKFLAD